MAKTRTISAKWSNPCTGCGHKVTVGEAVLWTPGVKGVKHTPGKCGAGPAPVAKPAAVEAVGGFERITELFAIAKAHLKHPKIRFTVEGVPVKIWLAGNTSKYAGKICVADNVAYGKGGKFYGAISDGVFSKTKYVETSVPKLGGMLKVLNDHPAEFAAAFGEKTGHCVFCMLTLTDPKSVKVGYGPICAGHYGLPWGVKELTPAKSAPACEKVEAYEEGFDAEYEKMAKPWAGTAAEAAVGVGSIEPEIEITECGNCGTECGGNCFEAELAAIECSEPATVRLDGPDEEIVDCSVMVGVC